VNGDLDAHNELVRLGIAVLERDARRYGLGRHARKPKPLRPADRPVDPIYPENRHARRTMREQLGVDL
jgi:hypothetical protein